jgi:hypothetical protein
MRLRLGVAYADFKWLRQPEPLTDEIAIECIGVVRGTRQALPAACVVLASTTDLDVVRVVRRAICACCFVTVTIAFSRPDKARR